MSPYSMICGSLLLPISDIFTGRKIFSRFQSLQKLQWCSELELKNFQDEKIRDVLQNAYKYVPYYRKALNDCGLAPGDIRSADDLVKLPLLTKDIIRREGKIALTAGKTEPLVKEMTSGSTGEQCTFYLSREAQGFTYAAELLFFSWGGYRTGIPFLQTGMSLKRGFMKKTKDFLFRCTYVSAFGLTDSDLSRICMQLEKKRIKILIGYASSLYCIADYARRHQITVPLKSVISLGDMLFEHYRNCIEMVFSCRVTDTYGSCEGFMVAGQCPEQSYHVCMPLNFVEILDNEGSRVPNGEPGRVVLTRLDLNPMPLIRYEIGDLASLSAAGRCKCGRGFAMLAGISGRNTDIVVTPAGHKLIVHFFTAIFEHEPDILQFQVRQEQAESIHILIVPSPKYSSRTEERVRNKILEKCNHDIKIHFEKTDDIPPTSSGKRRFVISNQTIRTAGRRESD